MKKSSILFAGVLASTVLLAQAATGEDQRGERMRDWQQKAQARFDQADSNHDGAISQSEWQSAQLRESSERFKAADTNRDGKLTREEMQSMRGHRMDGGRGGSHERLRALDTDGDGQFSRAEIGSSMPKLAENFDRLDSNRDGKLSHEELHAGWEQRRAERRDAAVPSQR